MFVDFFTYFYLSIFGYKRINLINSKLSTVENICLFTIKIDIKDGLMDENKQKFQEVISKMRKKGL